MRIRPFIDTDGNVNVRAQAAIDELKGTILTRHPEATFEVGPGTDNPTAIHLDVYVDLDDPGEVLDEIIDRVVDIQVDEGIPLHVIPLHTPARALERIRAHDEQRQAQARSYSV
jgi:hypothetical protein